jgi:hypothetical protein
MYEEPVVAMYERSMMDEVGAMPVGCVPAAHAAPGHRHATTTPTATHVTTAHVTAAAHMTPTTMACHGK